MMRFTNHSGRAIHHGSASALAVVFRAWSIQAGVPASELIAQRTAEGHVENILAKRVLETKGKMPSLAPAAPGAKP